MNSQDAAMQVLELVTVQVPGLRSAPHELTKSFGAAGLMRCCALLRGILALENAQLAALTGILGRQHWETWLVSLYVVLGGEQAIQAVAGDNIYWRRRLERSLKLDPNYQPKWPSNVVKLNYKALSDRVLELLRERGEPEAGPVTGYEITYSFQSTYSLHANVSTITPHIEYGEDEWSVNAEAPPPLADALLTPVLHTVHLAQYVLKECGLPADALEAVASELLNSVSHESRDTASNTACSRQRV